MLIAAPTRQPTAAADNCCKSSTSTSTTAAATPEFPVSSVRFLRELCSDGRFGGRVYFGELTPLRPSCGIVGGQLAVVIKTLGREVDARTRTDFWLEADMLNSLQHPHIATVIGVTGRDNSMTAATVIGCRAVSCMLFDCSSNFDNLHRCLIRYAAATAESSSSEGTGGPPLDPIGRLNVAVQIAAGMEYLSCRGIVHGDLAARNVSVTVLSASPLRLVAKVSVGLGISAVLYPDDYCHQQLLFPSMSGSYSHSSPQPGPVPPMPVRWMSPESIATAGQALGPPADVWSYGVTLWEVCSDGRRPYDGYTDDEVVELILAGHLLPLATDNDHARRGGVRSSRICQKLMVDCWNRSPLDRPTFSQIRDRLERCLLTDFVAAESSMTDSMHGNSSIEGQRRQVMGLCDLPTSPPGNNAGVSTDQTSTTPAAAAVAAAGYNHQPAAPSAAYLPPDA
jgi:serine/threonine protein kinase